MTTMILFSMTIFGELKDGLSWIVDFMNLSIYFAIRNFYP